MNVFFSSNDREVWINRTYMKGVIENTLKDLPNKKKCKRFANLLTGFLDACVRQDIKESDERNDSMTDKKEKRERALAIIRNVSMANPDLRLGQLIINVIPVDLDLYYITDEDLMEYLNDYLPLKPLEVS